MSGKRISTRGHRKIDEIESDQDFIRRTIFSQFQPRQKISVVEWCKKHVRMPYSAIQERFDLDRARYIELPLEYGGGNQILNGSRVWMTTVIGAVQSSKSTLEEALACYFISQDPGPMMWNFQTNDDASEAAKMRLMSLFYATEPVAKLLPPKFSTKMVSFDRLALIIQGAEARSNLQSKSIRIQINDEFWMWPHGHVGEALKRVTAFWNKVVVNVSTGAVVGSEAHQTFLNGTQHEWMFTCRCCGKQQKYHIKRAAQGDKGGLTWDDDARVDGSWNKQRVKDSVRYECDNEKCSHVYYDTAIDRENMLHSSEYVQQNFNPKPGEVSFHYNAMTVPWIRWADLAEEFLTATATAHRGDLRLLQEFVQKRLADFWENRPLDDEVVVTPGGYFLGEMPVWDDEYIRFGGADVQDDHFWVVMRAYALNGDSKMVSCGRIDTWEELRQFQLDHGIPRERSKQFHVDSSFGPQGMGPRAVYYQCCVYGWTALQGDDRIYFELLDAKTGLKKQSAYGPMKLGDPLIGLRNQDLIKRKIDPRKMIMRACPVFRWSNPSIKDILDHQLRGKGAKFENPDNVPEEWKQHMEAEVRRVGWDKKTGKPAVYYEILGRKPNHLRDCECECLFGALKAGLIDAAEPSTVVAPESVSGEKEYVLKDD